MRGVLLNAMDISEVTERVKGVFGKVFPETAGTFDPEKEQRSFENWDSFAHLELVSALESEFGVTFSLQDVATIDRPRGFIELIAKKAAK